MGLPHAPFKEPSEFEVRRWYLFMDEETGIKAKFSASKTIVLSTTSWLPLAKSIGR